MTRVLKTDADATDDPDTVLVRFKHYGLNDDEHVFIGIQECVVKCHPRRRDDIPLSNLPGGVGRRSEGRHRKVPRIGVYGHRLLGARLTRPGHEDNTARNLNGTALENTVELIIEYGLSFGGEIWPRVQWAFDDTSIRDDGGREVETLVREARDHLNGVIVPKIIRLADVERTAAVVADAEYGCETGRIGLSVIVETAQAKSDRGEIAAFVADSRLTGLVFGPVDYTADLGAREIACERPAWPGLMEEHSNEASANDLVSIGGPFDRLFHSREGVTVYDADGNAHQVEREVRVGFDRS